MSGLRTPTKSPQSLPQSPRRLCEINFSTIAEGAENLQLSPNKKNRENIRLNWLKVISSAQKLQQMQTTFNYLRYVNIDNELRKFRLKLALKNWYRRLQQEKWRMLASELNHENYTKQFQERAKRICEVRAKHASEFLAEQNELCPDFDEILQNGTTINSISNLQGKYLNSLREQREFEDAEEARLEAERLRRLQEEEEEEVIEREILPDPVPPVKFTKKWIITFVVAAVIGIIIGYALFWKRNEKVISYLGKLNKGETVNNRAIESPFEKISGPKQRIDPSLQ